MAIQAVVDKSWLIANVPQTLSVWGARETEGPSIPTTGQTWPRGAGK